MLFPVFTALVFIAWMLYFVQAELGEIRKTLQRKEK